MEMFCISSSAEANCIEYSMELEHRFGFTEYHVRIKTTRFFSTTIRNEFALADALQENVLYGKQSRLAGFPGLMQDSLP